MNCEQTRELLESLANGKQGGGELRALRAHLASCSRCGSRLSASDWIELLPAIDEEIEPSEGFSARFHAKLPALRSPASDRLRGASWLDRIAGWGWPRQLAAVASLAALIAVGLFLGRYFGEAPEYPAALADLEVAEQLPLFDDMAVISNLELLEDLDTIENLPAAKN